MTRYGILDFGAVSESSGRGLQLMAERAQLAEAMGFDEFWVTEHHLPHVHHSSPIVAITYLASQTTSIRIGAGGILLPYRSPFQVAEDFFALTSLYPGRIELGVGPGPGGAPEAVRALLDDPQGRTSFEEYDGKLRRLVEYARRRVPSGFDGVHVPAPAGAPSPPVTVLGKSERSARVAAELGASYIHGLFIGDPDPQAHVVTSALQSFRRGTTDASARAGIALTCLAARTHRELADLARLNLASGGKAHNVEGTVAEVRAELEQLCELLEPELILFSLSPSIPHEAQCRSFAALRKALDSHRPRVASTLAPSLGPDKVDGEA